MLDCISQELFNNEPSINSLIGNIEFDVKIPEDNYRCRTEFDLREANENIIIPGRTPYWIESPGDISDENLISIIFS